MTDPSPPLDWTRLRDLFHQAMDLPNGERRAWLDRLRDSEPALHQELASLLEAAPAVATARLSELAPDLIEDLGQAEARDPIGLLGQTVGGWHVQALIGEGGMGSVYRVQRDQGGFTQIGALKTLSGSQQDRERLRRFESERQILARLDHPNIAQILDGGTLESGTPYFVMAYIDGARIDRHCHQQDLDLRRRLQLFLTILDAVSSAHRALIVHRDLKPANILVDQHGEVRLLDFGIAKLLDQDAANARTHTLDQRRMLTLRYGSPEQIQGETITTTCDQFALGVILFELLSGHWPFGSVHTEALAMARAIVEREPVSLATVVTDCPIPKSWISDLDAIIGKCLRKDPRSRYASVDALADDVRALMAGEPVRARTGDRIYRWRKWLSRYRWVVAAGLALTLGVVSTAWTWRSQREAALAAAAEAELARQRAMTVAGFLDELLTSVDPKVAQGQDTTLLRDLLAKANARIDTELAGEPSVSADLKQTIANSLIAIGEGKAALAVIDPLFRSLNGRFQGEDARQIAEIQIDALLGTGQADQAETLAEQLFAAERDELGIAHGSTLATAGIIVRLKTQRRDLQAAKEFGNKVLAQVGENGAKAQQALLQGELVQTLSLLSERDTARTLQAQVLASLVQVYGPDDVVVLQAKAQSGMLAFHAGDAKRAVEIYRALLADYQRIFGATHPQSLNIQGNLASALAVSGELEAAIAMLQPIYERNLQTLGADHRQTLSSLGSLASVKLKAGQVDAALPDFERYLEVCTRTYGPSHDSCVDRRAGYGRALLAKARYEDAERELLAAYSGKLTMQSRNFSGPEAVAEALATLYERWQKPEQAKQWQAKSQKPEVR